MVRPSVLESVFGCLSSSFLGTGVDQGTGGGWGVLSEFLSVAHDQGHSSWAAHG